MSAASASRTLVVETRLGSDRLARSLIEGAVAEHGVEDVGTASGEGEECLVVAFALADLAVVVDAGFGVAERGERGEEHRVLEDLVPAS